MFPISKVKDTPFRGNADSHVFNTGAREHFLDLVNLCTQATEMRYDLDWALKVQDLSEQFYGLRIQELETELALIKTAYEKEEGKEKYLLTVDKMQEDDRSPYPALIDTYNEMATIRPSGSPRPKLYLIDAFTGDTVMSQNLNIYCDPKADDIITFDEGLKTMVDPDSDRFWLRKMIRKSPEPVTTAVYIDIPESIITSRDINYITISPYPAGSIDIESVDYLLDNGGYATIPSSKFENATNLALVFAPIGTRQVRINLKQKHYIADGAKYTYYLGLRHVGIFNLTYQFNRGDLKIPITFPDEATRVIDKVKPLFINEGSLTDTSEDKKSIFSYGFYKYLPGGGLELIRDLISDKEVLLKVSLGSDAVNSTAPALQAIELTSRIIT